MIKFKKATFILFGLLLTSPIFAQPTRPLIIAVQANATTLPTHTGEIFKNIHPGFVVGTAFQYKQGAKYQLSQTVKAGYIYHRFVHHAVQLYSELEYKRWLKQRFNVSGAIGAGYVHLFAATEVFRRNNEGEYEKKPNWGRPQVMGSLALGLGYLLNQNKKKPMEVFARYQFLVQAPFVRQYVPVLPNSAVQLGVSCPLFNSKNKLNDK